MKRVLAPYGVKSIDLKKHLINIEFNEKKILMKKILLKKILMK